ncbi:hypothetical protein G7077_02295 [Sphingomonas piscis]|uniref:Argininosuccinate lyase n=1 Tax=Sphingomonas piscis TaxID=2714943 RepID=A0A6G7YMF0_9SPHN|nr:hypothetical protein [Sphingomonas piscis]QIK77918.1 hypothetical protein G7077_02295 [Sphingomonas piscis]
MRLLVSTIIVLTLAGCVSPAAERQAAIDIGADAAADLDKQGAEAPATTSPAPNK